MSKVNEIKQRLDRLSQLGKKVQEQFAGMKGAEGEQVKSKAKKQGAKLGVGVGVSVLGAVTAAVAGLYVLAVIILAVNAALNRPWLSALIVVGGFLLIGGGVVAVGVSIARPAAKELSKTTEDLTKELKATSEEMKAEVEVLQKLVKAEAQQTQQQIKDVAPVAVPVAAGAYLAYRLFKRACNSRKEKRRILRVIEMFSEAQASEEE